MMDLKRLLHFAFCLLTAATLWAQDTTPAAIPAFPGAEGFGAYSKGGRGGRVYRVTNLSDSGPGSLRAAIEAQAPGPRTVLFGVGGTIHLESRLNITNSYVTIAGQTAPGDGICLRGYPLMINADHVVIRYLRIRLGDEAYLASGGSTQNDAISISSGHHIIVDHCSTSWSLDEVLSAATDLPTLSHVTVQWCFITEALNPEGHSYGALIRGTGDARYTYHHNLFAHNRSRNPRPGNYNSNPYTVDPLGLLLDFRNNVIYNWSGNQPGYNADTDSVTRLNYVGNYVIPGPDSNPNGRFYDEGSHHNKAYFAGNYFNASMPSDQYSKVSFSSKYPTTWTTAEIAAYRETAEFPAGTISTESAPTAFKRVLEEAGAIEPERDAVDTRIVAEVRSRTGGIINSQSEVGGWPTLESADAPTDTDGDGMPDFWELDYGFDPLDASDGPEDRNGDGYTNLEDYLNGTPVSPAPEPLFLRGDFNGNGELELADSINMLSAQFLGEPAVMCEDAIDVDDDGEQTVTDAINNLSAQFLGTGRVASPYVTDGVCGIDETPDGLGCESSPFCATGG